MKADFWGLKFKGLQSVDGVVFFRSFWRLSRWQSEHKQKKEHKNISRYISSYVLFALMQKEPK